MLQRYLQVVDCTDANCLGTFLFVSWSIVTSKSSELAFKVAGFASVKLVLHLALLAEQQVAA